MADIHPAPDASMMVPVASMDIQAPMEDLSGMAAAAEAQAGPGSDRQQATQRLLSSAQGFGEIVITGGMSGGGGEDWPSDVRP